MFEERHPCSSKQEGNSCGKTGRKGEFWSVHLINENKFYPENILVAPRGKGNMILIDKELLYYGTLLRDQEENPRPKSN